MQGMRVFPTSDSHPQKPSRMAQLSEFRPKLSSYPCSAWAKLAALGPVLVPVGAIHPGPSYDQRVVAILAAWRILALPRLTLRHPVPSAAHCSILLGESHRQPPRRRLLHQSRPSAAARAAPRETSQRCT